MQPVLSATAIEASAGQAQLHSEHDGKEDEKEDDHGTGDDPLDRHNTPLVDINDLIGARPSSAPEPRQQVSSQELDTGRKTSSQQPTPRDEWIRGLLSRFRRAAPVEDGAVANGTAKDPNSTLEAPNGNGDAQQAGGGAGEGGLSATLLTDLRSIQSYSTEVAADAARGAGEEHESNQRVASQDKAATAQPLTTHKALAPHQVAPSGTPATDADIDPALLSLGSQHNNSVSTANSASAQLQTASNGTDGPTASEGDMARHKHTTVDEDGVPLDLEARRIWWLRGGQNPRPAHFSFDEQGRRVGEEGQEVDQHGFLVDHREEAQPAHPKRGQASQTCSTEHPDVLARTVRALLDEAPLAGPSRRNEARSLDDQDGLLAYRSQQARPWRWPRHPDNIIFDVESEEANQRAQLNIEQTISLYARHVTRKWAETGVPELGKRPWAWEGELAPLKPLPQGDDRSLDKRLDGLEENILDLLQQRRRHGEEEIAYLKRVEELLLAEEDLSDANLEAILRHGESTAEGVESGVASASEARTTSPSRRPIPESIASSTPQANGHASPGSSAAHGGTPDHGLLSQRHGKPLLSQDEDVTEGPLASQADGKPIPPSQAKPTTSTAPRTSSRLAAQSLRELDEAIESDAETDADDAPSSFDYDFLFYTLLSDCIDDVELQDRIVDAFRGMAPSSRFDFSRPSDQDLYLQAPSDYLPREQCQALMAMVETSINQVLGTLLAARVKGVRRVRQGKPPRGWASVFAAAALVLPKDIVLAAQEQHRKDFADYPSGRRSTSELAERLRLAEETIGSNRYRLCGDQLKDRLYDVDSDTGSGSEAAVEGEIEIISISDSSDEQEEPASQPEQVEPDPQPQQEYGGPLADAIKTAIRQRAQKNAQAERARAREAAAAAALAKQEELRSQGMEIWRRYQARQAEREAALQKSAREQTSSSTASPRQATEQPAEGSRRRRLIPEVVLDLPTERGSYVAMEPSGGLLAPLRPTWKTSSSPAIPGRRILPRPVPPSPLEDSLGVSEYAKHHHTAVPKAPAGGGGHATASRQTNRTHEQSRGTAGVAIRDTVAQASVNGPKPTEPAPVVKKKRGRPTNAEREARLAAAEAAAQLAPPAQPVLSDQTAQPAEPAPKRKRGRPSNAERAERAAAAAAATHGHAEVATPPPAPPKKRGRPSNAERAERAAAAERAQSSASAPPPKKRGRPSNAGLATSAAAVEPRFQTLGGIPTASLEDEVDELMSSPAPERSEYEQKPPPGQLSRISIPESVVEIPPPKRRGRPPKRSLPIDLTSEAENAPRGPGRPRKTQP